MIYSLCQIVYQLELIILRCKAISCSALHACVFRGVNLL